MLRRHIREYGDVYLVVLCSTYVGVTVLLTAVHHPAPQSPLLFTSLAAGIGLLIVPGYSLGLAIGLDRHGAAVLAGSSIVLSVALLAVLGAFLWTLFQRFLWIPIESGMAGITLLFCAVALRRRRASGSARESLATRWTALLLLVLPMTLTIVLLRPRVPMTPRQPYTEFSIVQKEPQLVVEIVNHEETIQSYVIVAKNQTMSTNVGPIKLNPGQRSEVPIRMSFDSMSPLNLFLYRSGDESPYRVLSVR